MNFKKAISIVGVIVLAAGLLAGCGGGKAVPKPGQDNIQTSNLTGAGSTFVYPFFSKAFNTYGGQNSLQVNYQSIGSGGGIQQFTQRTVDFGASDVPMNDKELEAASKTGGEVVQIPVTLGAEVIAYNLPEVREQLKFTPEVIADIYLGKIKNWNDPAIVKENPNVALPNQPITVVHRSDGSGTTYIFTDYLSSVSKEWEGKVGRGKDVKWPAGVGAKGNEGVAGQVLQTPYTIGYVELAYAMQTNMSYGLLKNKEGRFVVPSLEGATAAAAQLPEVTAKQFSIVNAPGADSYPIAGYAWVLLFKDQKDTTKRTTLVKLFEWVVTQGQNDARSLYYAPLPESVQKKSIEALKSVQSNGTSLLK
ncbi:phosphate ABC transporter substrate-binding protein PstS [Pelosinus sp. IPA-1]|uniref:phosphate ABC transporter substrate-binding protein PstS n=1 Tax=Pelosinus sp. IPA-1 TaxID=3029569 RepID=UPI00255646E0|nr:phosphate ABC transporter substrate-binding protein PstS [Pelosinus sp. IPA-1]